MPYSDPKKQKEAQHEWYLTVVKERKAAWFLDNGPCKKCGSSVDLELDHIDPNKKVSHNIWSWSDKKREVELAKCQALCHECHAEKTSLYHKEIDIWKSVRKFEPEGMAWCTGHERLLPRDSFHPKKIRPNGLHAYCKKCRSDGRKQGKSL